MDWYDNLNVHLHLVIRLTFIITVFMHLFVSCGIFHFFNNERWFFFGFFYQVDLNEGTEGKMYFLKNRTQKYRKCPALLFCMHVLVLNVYEFYAYLITCAPSFAPA